MSTFTSLDDIRSAVGTEIGTSRWITLSQSRIDDFAETTEDRQWLHVDPERAANGPFGTTIAHGYLTLSFLASMLDEIIDVPWASAGINYGLNTVRFPSPAPVDSRVRGRAKLLSTTDIPDGIQIITLVTIEREGSEKPVCVAESVNRILL